MDNEADGRRETLAWVYTRAQQLAPMNSSTCALTPAGPLWTLD